jgi:hypothetical protein
LVDYKYSEDLVNFEYFPLFASGSLNVFWGPILEKAYAKTTGAYT